MLTPVFLIVFPLLHVPRLTTVEAIGTALLLERSGFGAGVSRYVSMRLVDFATARRIVLVTLPLGGVGAIVSRHVPAQGLPIGYGIGMLGLAWLLSRKEPAGDDARGGGDAPAVVCESERAHDACAHGKHREITSTTGHVYSYCAHGLGLQRAISGGGAFVAGLISTGVGEATLPALVRRSRFPVPVAPRPPR